MFFTQELNAEKEQDFLKILALIKNKDPKIYNKDMKFFSDGRCSVKLEKKTFRNLLIELWNAIARSCN